MGLPGAATNQLSILCEFLLSGECYTRLFGTVYLGKKKKSQPPPTHQNLHQHNHSLHKNIELLGFTFQPKIKGHGAVT